MRKFTLLLALFFLASCSLVPTSFTKSKNSIKSQPIAQGKIVKISATELYEKFDPGQRGFDKLFKANLPESAYRKYRKKLDAVIKKHQKHGAKFARPSLIHDESIAKRKRTAKKEWIWGNTEKSKISQFYDLFQHSYLTHENKIAYQTSKTRNDGVMSETPQKVIPTESQFTAYFYRIKGTNDVYIIDPYLFIQSIL